MCLLRRRHTGILSSHTYTYAYAFTYIRTHPLSLSVFHIERPCCGPLFSARTHFCAKFNRFALTLLLRKIMIRISFHHYFWNGQSGERWVLIGNLYFALKISIIRYIRLMCVCLLKKTVRMCLCLFASICR